jgi:hypothetical protein
MTERNSRRGRKPLIGEPKLMTIHTSKKVKLVINGQDEVTIPKGTNLLVVRSL